MVKSSGFAEQSAYQIDATQEEFMFRFFHPTPVVDSRPVAVKVVQQKTSTQQATATLVVSRQEAVLPLLTRNYSSSQN